MVEINDEIWYRMQCHEVFSLLPIRGTHYPMFSANVLFDDNDLEDLN
jgi:hypothetical protein